jgi:glycosyltransferase involved in cell wall biosynthesis
VWEIENNLPDLLICTIDLSASARGPMEWAKHQSEQNEGRQAATPRLRRQARKTGHGTQHQSAMVVDPEFSLVTTCKGRLEDLKRTIGAMSTQHRAELIVVDYNCPQDTAGFVRRNYPNVRVVKEQSDPLFHLSKARNMGAEAATGRIIVFVDADILLKKEFTLELGKFFQNGSIGNFWNISSKYAGVVGSCVVEKKNWKLVSGYDEILRGYGQEEFDFYERLRILGLKQINLPVEILIDDVIPTSELQKSNFYSEKDIRKTIAINSTYFMLKRMILLDRNICELDLESKKSLFNSILMQYEKGIHGPGDNVVIGINIPQGDRKNHRFTLMLGVNIQRFK